MQPAGPPPARKTGSNTTLVVLILVGALVAFVFFVAVLAGAVVLYRMRRASAQGSSGDAALTQTYATQNGLVVVHYPADFAAKSLDHATLLVSKRFLDGADEAVLVAGVSPPITDDVDEFSRLLINAMTKNIQASGDVWTETHRRRGACFKAYSGLEVEGSFVAQHVTKMNVRMCFFMTPNRGFELKSIVPASHETTERPLLESILEATEVK